MCVHFISRPDLTQRPVCKKTDYLSMAAYKDVWSVSGQTTQVRPGKAKSRWKLQHMTWS